MSLFNTLTTLIESGGSIMLPLLLCSILAIAVVIERSLFWVNLKQKRCHCDLKQIIQAIQQKQCDTAVETAKKSCDPIAKIFGQVLKNPSHHHPAIFDEGITEYTAKMKRKMTLLESIISIAPLLGILGTVLGIIDSFDVLGQAGIQDPKAVTSGIAKALLTTAGGLAIAILTTIPTHTFHRLIEKETDRLAQFISRFEQVYTPEKTS